MQVCELCFEAAKTIAWHERLLWILVPLLTALAVATVFLGWRVYSFSDAPPMLMCRRENGNEVCKYVQPKVRKDTSEDTLRELGCSRTRRRGSRTAWSEDAA